MQATGSHNLWDGLFTPRFDKPRRKTARTARSHSVSGLARRASRPIDRTPGGHREKGQQFSRNFLKPERHRGFVEFYLRQSNHAGRSGYHAREPQAPDRNRLFAPQARLAARTRALGPPHDSETGHWRGCTAPHPKRGWPGRHPRNGESPQLRNRRLTFRIDAAEQEICDLNLADYH